MAKDTKERILSAALDMFSRNGYAGANIRELSLPMEFLNGEDKWGQSGTPAELLAAYGLDAAHIVLAAKKAIARK